MSQKISKEQVAYVAHLARLAMGEEELEKHSRELSGILDYVATIQGLDTAGIPATFQVLPGKNVFREDVVKESLEVEEALKNAPEKEDNYFKMPKILEGTENSG